jgi:coenzyme PQQ precursor peptide PqqA
MLFSEAELLGMNEFPHRAVVDLQPAPGKFRDQPTQGGISIFDPLQQPVTMFAGNRLWPVAAHVARRDFARKSILPKQRGENEMTWKAPKIVEVAVVAVGLEINMYACAIRN